VTISMRKAFEAAEIAAYMDDEDREAAFGP
jgi:hypothetical protein